MNVELFRFLQGADFYRDLHATAAALLPSGNGRSWLDVGCGPGLLTRLAAERGYQACGLDRDADMILAARQLAAGCGAPVEFVTSDVRAALASGRRYDVVSASSLVVVTPNASETLASLRALAKPGGKLLVIEASPTMSLPRALKVLLTGQLGKRSYMLLPWAMARAGKTLPDRLFEQSRPPATRRPLLSGLVNAWIFEVSE